MTGSYSPGYGAVPPSYGTVFTVGEAGSSSMPVNDLSDLTNLNQTDASVYSEYTKLNDWMRQMTNIKKDDDK